MGEAVIFLAICGLAYLLTYIGEDVQKIRIALEKKSVSEQPPEPES